MMIAYALKMSTAKLKSFLLFFQILRKKSDGQWTLMMTATQTTTARTTSIMISTPATTTWDTIFVWEKTQTCLNITTFQKYKFPCWVIPLAPK